MIFLSIALCVVLILQSWYFYDLYKKIEQLHYEERQVLLNRIENPKYQPPLSKAERQADLTKLRELREESEQFGLVGKIVE